MKDAPEFFESPGAFRAWLHRSHAKAAEVYVGFHKRHTGEPTMTWPESVAEALCYGWIDGIRRRVDENRYVIRFTPRRPGSVWSAVNIRMIAELEAAGRMMPAGRAAFEARPHKTGPKSHGYKAQKKDGTLADTLEREFKKNKGPWAFFEAQPPGYRGALSWWVMQAKQDETQRRRLAKLIEYSAAGKRVV